MYVFVNKDSAIDEAILLSAGHIEKIIDRVLKMKAEELDSRGVDREEWSAEGDGAEWRPELA